MDTDRRVLPTHLPTQAPTGLTCIVCQTGTMIPAIDEGEPDYTDHYRCLKCDHHADIPMVGIIMSQLLTGVLGVALVVFLMFTQGVLLTEQINQQAIQFQTVALLVLGGIFQVGFIFAIYAAYKGFKVRHLYSQPRRPSSN